jgi:nucleoside-diphosphate-sugar epimerase
VILRFGQIYGAGAEKDPPSGTIAIAGRWLVVGRGSHRVPLVYIENVVDALLLAADRELPNGTLLQVVDPEGIRQKEYVEWVRGSGRPVKAAYIPKWFLYLAAWGVELLGKLLKRSVPLNRYRISSIRPVWPCDCREAEAQLGWKPRYLIAEGMSRTFGDKKAVT